MIDACKGQSTLVSKLKDYVKDLEDVGTLMAKEVNSLKKHLDDAMDIGDFGAIPQDNIDSLKKKLSESEDDCKGSHVVMMVPSRDILKLHYLFRMSPRAVWSVGYEERWMDAPTKLDEESTSLQA